MTTFAWMPNIIERKFGFVIRIRKERMIILRIRENDKLLVDAARELLTQNLSSLAGKTAMSLAPSLGIISRGFI